MPRVATLTRPRVGTEQGARRADVHRFFQDALVTPNQRGSKVPIGNSRVSRIGSKVPIYRRPIEYVDDFRVPKTSDYVRKVLPIFRLLDIAQSIDNLSKVSDYSIVMDPARMYPYPGAYTLVKTVICGGPAMNTLNGIHVGWFSGDATGAICAGSQSWPLHAQVVTAAGVPTGNTIAVTAGANRTIVYGGANAAHSRFANEVMHHISSVSAVNLVSINRPVNLIDQRYRMQNPNITRLLPSALTMYQLGYGAPVASKIDPVVNPRLDRALSFTLRNGTFTRRTAPSHVRKPPGRGVKEGKVLSRSAKIMIGIFKALDTVSEYSELVDAFYQSLPEDVRKRWEKGRDPRGLLDSAGQYGIDGADWKLQALWYNWDKIDGPQVFKNIVANEYQDKILGLLNRNLPRNIGRAVDPGMKEVNKQIEQFLKTMGFD